VLQCRDLVLQCSRVGWYGGVGRGGEQQSGAGHRDVGIIFGVVWKDLETRFRDRSSREKDLVRPAKLVRGGIRPVSEECRYDGERAVRMFC
jgi:hypothetical protein